MAPKLKSRAKQFSELEDRPTKDYDPEDTRDKSDGDDSGDDSEIERAATEHYAPVGKSKLRQKEALALGPQYRGARVSRKALEDSDDDDDDEEDESEESEGREGDSESDDEYDDPDKVDIEAEMKRLGDEDFEIDSDEAFGESDKERFKGYTFRGSSTTKGRKKRPIAADFMTDSEQEAKEEEGASDEDDDDGEDGVSVGSEDSNVEMNGVDGEDAGDSSEDSDGGAPIGSESENEDEPEASEDEDAPRSQPTSDKKAILAAISDSVRQDAEKGQAVRQQRKIFDGLLNIRVRLQKALVAANSFGVIGVGGDGDDDDVAREAYEAAEEAALKLWSTIDDLHSGIKGASKTGEKRKREVDLSTSTETLWGYMDETERAARQNRRKVLDKWSGKIGATTVPVGSKLNLNAMRNSICSVLEEQLLDPERLIKRSRVPRSCAPLQATKGLKEDADIYDDADFYQLLLKELVDQRSADTAMGGQANGGVVTVQWAAMKEAKASKVVDRKASRGRKMRFTVHEKLQGFMAPEDRRAWEQDAIDRFFGTLFGQKMQLNEEEEESEEEDEINAEEAGLRLFRS